MKHSKLHGTSVYVSVYKYKHYSENDWKFCVCSVVCCSSSILLRTVRCHGAGKPERALNSAPHSIKIEASTTSKCAWPTLI